MPSVAANHGAARLIWPPDDGQAVWYSKFPFGTRLTPEQSVTGGLVSTTVTVWLQDALRPQAFVACQVRVMICGQTPLVRSLTTFTVMNGSQQVVFTIG